MSSILDVKNLSINFETDHGLTNAVNNISFSLEKGKTLGLVGESGSGKSVTCLSIMRLLSTPPAKIQSGEILFKNQDLLKFTESNMRKVRGNRISMIFQEPMTSLNPIFTVGYQVVEALQLHQHLNKNEAWERSIDLFDKVGILEPRLRVKSYPHELSGGQRQRVMIAMAIACAPEILIADEPTTALDVTIQKQILDLLKDLQQQFNMSLLFVTHDLGVIGEIADDVMVMYKGELVEKNQANKLFRSPRHPYTKGLLACRPSLVKKYNRLAMVSDFIDNDGNEIEFDDKKLGLKENRDKSPNAEVLLEITNLKKYFPLKSGFFGQNKKWIKAVDDVSFKVRKGHTLGLVGESGCGKTTLGRTILRLIEPSEGNILYNGKNILKFKHEEMRAMRRKIQIIFQDPYASLNPRMSIGSALVEPMTIHGLGKNKQQRIDRAVELMEKVGLPSEFLKRYPHEFSGGQRQRICIARALAVEPEFIVCDESVSALDVSIQAQILNLLIGLQEELKLTYIFISHDLAVVKFISDDIAVMKQGKIVELAKAEELYKNPQNDYTKKLLDSIPKGI
jgi:peptide/nickel transport system ATP-binding protein